MNRKTPVVPRSGRNLIHEGSVRRGRRSALASRVSLTGFSLTEVVVVLALMVIASAIIIPAQKNMQIRNKSINCAGNLRVMYQALKTYWMDEDNAFPPFDRCDEQGITLDPSPRGGGLVLLHATQWTDSGSVEKSRTGYLRSQRSLHCPADRCLDDPKMMGLCGIVDAQLYSSYQSPDPPLWQRELDGSSQMGSYCLADRFTYMRTRVCPGENFQGRCGAASRDLRRQLMIFDSVGKALPQSHPEGDTVVTWCPHHREDLKRAGGPSDWVVYWDGSITLQLAPTPTNSIVGWLRTQTSQ